MTEALPIDPEVAKRLKSKKGKELYGYQADAIEQIMGRIRKFPSGYNLLYQLPILFQQLSELQQWEL